MKINTAQFFISNSKYESVKTANLPELAIIGRSNVGKSTLINALCNNNKLAHTSAKPGKTKLINHFIINNNWYLVDLPGYGYAKVSKTEKASFETLITDYVLQRQSLKCLFILIDIRLEPQQIDMEFLQWCAENNIPFCILFTKADKLGKNELQKNKQSYLTTLESFFDELPNYEVTSAKTNAGIKETLNLFNTVLNSK